MAYIVADDYLTSQPIEALIATDGAGIHVNNV